MIKRMENHRSLSLQLTDYRLPARWRIFAPLAIGAMASTDHLQRDVARLQLPGRAGNGNEKTDR